MRMPNLRIITEENEDSQLKGLGNINKIIKENFPNLKKEIAINVREIIKMWHYPALNPATLPQVATMTTAS